MEQRLLQCEEVSEKHKSWSMPTEGFKDHVATDGSLLGNQEKWGAGGWAVVQLDYDEDMVPLLGMYGSMEAEYEVQRTTKRAELTAFLRLLTRVIGPVRVHVDNNGIIDGLQRGESQEREMPVYGKNWKNHMVWQKKHFGGSGACKGAPHKKRKEIYVAF